METSDECFLEAYRRKLLCTKKADHAMSALRLGELFDTIQYGNFLIRRLAIIDAMTKEEQQKPGLLDARRVRRIVARSRIPMDVAKRHVIAIQTMVVALDRRSWYRPKFSSYRYNTAN